MLMPIVQMYVIEDLVLNKSSIILKAMNDIKRRDEIFKKKKKSIYSLNELEI